jgi:hypothetical protein
MTDAELVERVCVEVLHKHWMVRPALDWSLAGLVLEEMRRRGWYYHIGQSRTLEGTLFTWCILANDSDSDYDGEDERPARAILLAALAAVEAEQ